MAKATKKPESYDWTISTGWNDDGSDFSEQVFVMRYEQDLQAAKHFRQAFRCVAREVKGLEDKQTLMTSYYQLVEQA